MRFFDDVVFLQHSLLLHESHARIELCQLWKPVRTERPAGIVMG